ncbi:hypothetical protein QN372_00255 [Undibacterium sp. RTI2.1]|uniref:hypothetical protein n=1 Tax=unclassified Undibacterium TaxID=2630295 RepID=UPI002B22F660|nr:MULTISPECIES: hypothetical protein [unclassified Undibacterium]MEB0029170.1 hypothetical protein [Undibacterium sp. RTI2.1]MEB0115478.1 hypothetical protein [Undibacterium sp. RTI2.2]
MTMKVTPAKTARAITRHKNLIRALKESVYAKRHVPLENQGDFVKERSLERLIGMAEGINALMEAVLFENNCYNGFSYIGLPKIVDGYEVAPIIGDAHPEYDDWAREYIIFKPL